MYLESVDYKNVLSEKEIESILSRCHEMQYDDYSTSLILQQAAEDMVRFCSWRLFYVGDANFELNGSELKFATSLWTKTAQMINNCESDFADNLE